MNTNKILLAYQKKGDQYLTPCFDEKYPIESPGSC